MLTRECLSSQHCGPGSHSLLTPGVSVQSSPEWRAGVGLHRPGECELVVPVEGAQRICFDSMDMSLSKLQEMKDREARRAALRGSQGVGHN